jgi:molybdate transport system substrate-binding protein
MTLESRKVDRMTGISSMAMRNVLAELGDAYEQQSGQPVSIVSVGGVDAARRGDGGEARSLINKTDPTRPRL